MAAPLYGHIERDERGVAWIKDANTKVREVVIDRIAFGCTIDEIHTQHPHLALAQIHAALAYYYDHQAEVESEIEAAAHAVADLQSEAGRQPTRAGLEARLRRRVAVG